MSIRALMFAALAVLVCMVQPGSAQQPRRGADIYTGPCVSELHAYCPNVLEGQGRQLNCLAAYAQSLTPACRARLVQRGALPPLAPVPTPAVVSAPTTIVVEAPPAPERPRYTPQMVHQRPAPQAKPRPAPAAPVAAAASATAATPTSQAAVATAVTAPAAVTSTPAASAMPALAPSAANAQVAAAASATVNITINQQLEQLPKTERAEEWRPWVSQIPVQEHQFCRLMQRFRHDYVDAEEHRNEVKQSIVVKKMREDLANLIPQGKFQNWIVRTVEVRHAADGSGAVIFQPLCDVVLIGSYSCGTDRAQYSGTVAEDSPLYREIAKLDHRDFVMVSGKVVASDEPEPGLALVSYRYFPAGSYCAKAEAGEKEDLFAVELDSMFKMVKN